MRVNLFPIYVLIIVIFSINANAQFKQIRIACVGNSITYGGLGDLSYPQQLGKILGEHYLVENFGVGGTTLLKKGDFPYWNEKSFFNALDFNPQILIIALGTNDSKPQNWAFKDDFYSDYLDLIREFRKNNRNPQIFVCSPTPVYKDGYGITNSIIKESIIPLIDSVRKTASTDLINYNLALQGHEDLFPDGIHPNAAGYALMAQTAYEAIQNSPSGITRFFYPGKSSFEKGESITLYWETTKDSKVTIDGITVNETDSMIVQPSQTTKYTLISEGEVSDTSEVTLQYIMPGKVKYFKAYPEFLDKESGDSSLISWAASNGSNVSLEGISVEIVGSQYVYPKSTTTYKFIAEGDSSDTSFVTIQVLDSDKINRAFEHTVTSFTSARGYFPEAAVDGNLETSWKSEPANTQWLMIDLEKDYNINKVILNWGETYAASYRLEALNEEGKLIKLYSNASADGEIDVIEGLTGEGRLVRLVCIKKNNIDSGYVLNEIEIYGKPSNLTNITQDKIYTMEFHLEQNYPNPFNPVTTIEYTIPEKSIVKLELFDIIGNRIAILVNEEKAPGKFSVNFDGSKFASGIYYYRIKANQFSKSGKMVLLK